MNTALTVAAATLAALEGVRVFFVFGDDHVEAHISAEAWDAYCAARLPDSVREGGHYETEDGGIVVGLWA